MSKFPLLMPQKIFKVVYVHNGKVTHTMSLKHISFILTIAIFIAICTASSSVKMNTYTSPDGQAMLESDIDRTNVGSNIAPNASPFDKILGTLENAVDDTVVWYNQKISGIITVLDSLAEVLQEKVQRRELNFRDCAKTTCNNYRYAIE